MKKERYSEERFMSILWDLYRNTSKGSTITRYCNFCREHNITNNLFLVLVENKILKKEKVRLNVRGKLTHSFSWVSIPPNMHMAKKLMEELMKKSKKDNANRKEKLAHQKLIELPELPVCEIIEMDTSKINPVYEITQSTNYNDSFIGTGPALTKKNVENDFIGTGPALNKENYVVNVPISNNAISNNVTLTSDIPKSENLRLSGHKAKTQKSISIAWGLISIKW